MTRDKPLAQTPLADIGVVGMAVMGRNLALNFADRGARVAVWSRDPRTVAQAVAESGGALVGHPSLQALVAGLDPPRRVLLMIQAGPPVDEVLATLTPLLSPGDVVIDGGNSLYTDTERREETLRALDLHFVGLGVSGGEEGARHGPSLMPGCRQEAYALLAPLLEPIAAHSRTGPCVTHVGHGGAGHFVKMVHNGIEYADMQLIAEAYHLLKALRGLGPAELAEIFGAWNEGPLESFLIELTARIFTVTDPLTQGFLVDSVLDVAGQKGTGMWTVKAALDFGVPVPSIAAAVDTRVLSGKRAAREEHARLLPRPDRSDGPAPSVEEIHDALLAAKIGAYAQGMALIHAASEARGWRVNLQEIARIWTGGCIIRARFLFTMMEAYERRPDAESLLLDSGIRAILGRVEPAWRRVVASALGSGIPVPGMASGLTYYDTLGTASLPTNLIGAQRDAFGAHTYQRVDDPEGPFVHSDWV